MIEVIGKRGTTFFLFVSAITLFLGGCISAQSFPHRARAGDTVTISLGSGQFVTRNNTTVVYTPDNDPANPVDLTGDVLAIFRLYPDKISQVSLDSAATGIPFIAYHEPWVSIATINLPLGMPEGTGTLQATTTAAYPAGTGSVNAVTMALEILPGVGAPFPMQYNYGGLRTGDVTDLEPVPHIIVYPGSIWSTYGAASYVLTVPIRKADGTPVLDQSIEVIAEDLRMPSTQSQVQLSWYRAGDTLTINFVSPTGMSGKELRCTIALHGSGGANPNQFSAPPSVNSVAYYDIDGNPVAGANPSVRLFQ